MSLVSGHPGRFPKIGPIGNLDLKTALFGVSLVLVLFFVSVGQAQSIQYSRLQRNVIEKRLLQFAGNDRVREATLKRLFEEAGCTGEHLKEEQVKHADSPNVICTLPGSSNEVIVVGAHFDHVSTGSGIVDNWSGASLLPSLYQSLSASSRRHTFIFIGFTGEELGMVGSRFYVKQIPHDELAHIHAMIDMDTLGLGPTEIWVSNSDPSLVKLLAGAASALGLPVKGMNVDGVGDSDGSSFKRVKIPVITLHSVTSETLRILHSIRDDPAAIKLDDYYDTYSLIAGYLAVLDRKLDEKAEGTP
ncbi:MAG TPA: M28 family peptidase [Acidobacteriota bacterium]|nr:M28 family peptidase [Acidobacteriota bacterium]